MNKKVISGLVGGAWLTALLVSTLTCRADDALQVPTHGNWQGQAIGLWKATRITYRSPNKPATQGKILKELLLGEDENHNTIAIYGETNEKFEYIRKYPGTVSSTWSDDNPIPIPNQTREDVLEIDGKEYPVLVKVFAPKPDKRSGVMKGSKIWELKSRPGFVLMHNQSQTDSFRGETYEYLITEQVVGVGSTNVHGKAVRFFRIQHNETVDGRTTSRMELLKSDDLPKQGLIHCLQTYYDEHGKEKSVTEKELAGFGHSPEEAATHMAMRSKRKYVALDSDAGKANVKHLMRQGIPEDVARRIVTTRISIEDLEYGRKRAGEIDAEWTAYKSAPSKDLRDKLLKKFQYIGSNTVGYIEPSLEKILLEISRADDSELRIMALTCLTGYVSVLYAPILEDMLIQEKQFTNQPALRILCSAKWGKPRRVLSQQGVDISSLPLRTIPYAPDALSIKELMNRFEVENKFRKSEVIELLGYYSTTEVRSLFTQLANELVIEDFTWGKTDNSYLVKNVIIAAANLNIENAPDLFLKWMAWNNSVGREDSAKPQDLAMKSATDMMLMVSGARLRDSRINAHISKLIAPGAGILAMFMSNEGLEKLGNIALDITPEKMEALLSKPIPMMLSGKPLKGDQLYGLLRLFRFSPDDQDLLYIMSKLAPDWTAETDYRAIAQARDKYWYTQRKGIQPFKVRELHPEILADILPSFGERGARIFIQLCAYSSFRKHMVPAIMKISHRRDEAREHLSQVRATGDRDRFLIGLALWCLGDTSRRAEYERYIRFEPLQRSRMARRAMCYLPFETVCSLLQNMRNNSPDNHFRMWASEVLSYHNKRESAEFIMSLWDEQITSRYNPDYGELFNRMAGQNFGMDRNKIRKWIRTLPPEKIEAGTKRTTDE